MADDSWTDELNIHKAMVLRYDVAARNLKLDRDSPTIYAPRSGRSSCTFPW